MKQLKQIHAYTLKHNIDHTKTLLLKLLEIPDIPYAHKLFDQIPHPTPFHFNKLIHFHSHHAPHFQCISLYTQMCNSHYHCPPNQHTFTFLFSACASLSSRFYGQIIHAHFAKSGFECDVYAVTALVDMYAKMGMLGFARKKFDEIEVGDVPTWNAMIAGYAKGGLMEDALELFDLMQLKNVVSWTAMISGYAQNGQYSNALEMFLRMEKEGNVRINEVTIASLLPACAKLGALEVGVRIEKYARENNLFKNLFVSNAILEMYARCGRIDTARRVFEEIRGRRNLCSWNSMIMGLAVHGFGLEGLHLFHEMTREGIAPDSITFVGVLLACTHGGLIAKGREIFESMKPKFSITPRLEHYGCMVDLLGRAGQLTEAYELIKSMPMKPDSVVWGALLGSCSFYNHVELAEIAAEFLFEMEPWNPGNYVILSNIYASTGKMEGVARLRKVMKGGRITKAAGYSCIEERGEIYKFIVEDRSHPRTDEIYALLDEVSVKMKLHKNDVCSDCDNEYSFLMESIET